MIQKKDNNILIRVEAFNGEQFVIHGLVLALFLCIALYGYFVSLSIMNVIANREASVESERLRSTVVALEQEYFNLSKSITADLATDVGLTDTTETEFVRRPNGMAANTPAASN